MAMRVYVVTAALILGVSVEAPAEPDLDECKWHLFERADVNSDDMLSRAEAAAHPLDLESDFFAVSDENGDGVLDRQEFEHLEVFVTCGMCPSVPGCRDRGG